MPNILTGIGDTAGSITDQKKKIPSFIILCPNGRREIINKSKSKTHSVPDGDKCNGEK